MKHCDDCKHKGDCKLENLTVKDLLAENHELLLVGTLGEFLDLNDDMHQDLALAAMGQLAKTSMMLQEINDRYETLLEAEEALNESR